METAWILYTIFRFSFALVFVGLHCVLMAGLFLEWRRDKQACRAAVSSVPNLSDSSVPNVSVIIPIHNEAERMAGLLRSLELQDYPSAEYIFVDDRSSDGSLAMIRRFAETGGNVRIITLTENPGLNHKQYALSRGIDAALGDLLLFTDADCEAPPSWIRAMALRMADQRIGAVIGPVFKLHFERSYVWGQSSAERGQSSFARRFFHTYQCFDHAIRYMYLAASTGIGAAGGGFGNNLILRRQALDSIGGYEQVPPSPTEDAALISQIRAGGKYTVRSACGDDVHVMTRGENSWAALVNQTLRWNNGGLFSPEISTRLNFGFLMVTISMGMIAIPFVPLIPSLWPLPAAVFLSMTVNTLATLRIFGAALPKAGPAWALHAVFTPLYFTFLTILGFCGAKVEWKGSEVR
ncbi:glycosyltransferase, family 2 [Treponema primitia ZAS-2]|uniref:Glycosyltransferase, family 2 n=1 Tax=Treponema primitia (strain ATCC BAA-887 / DSM 12427 / ZAS-2) TaxID=545694 RepID=F5YJM6_TREPZ|nr:glycosyltransferase [Treponema primitia]AEF86602.1 glycosyltransferase, family 2 [Treponema primitia ZAS-2]